MAFERETKKTRGPAKGGSRSGGGGKKTGGGSSFDKKPRSSEGRAPRSAEGRAPRKEFSDRPKRDFGDRAPRRERSSDDRPRRSYDDKPKRDFGDRPSRREGSSEDRPRRSFNSDRPKRDFGDRPKRDFGDRPPRKDFGDRPPRREGSSEDRPRRSYDDRPKRDFGDRPPRKDFGDRPPRREYSDDRPRRSYDDKPKRDFGDRPPRREYSEDRPKRSFDDKPKRDFGDRPERKKFDSDFTPKKREGFEKRSESAGDKPDAIKGHELLFYGVHAVHAALRNTARKVVQIWATESGQERLMEAWDKKRHPQPEIVERRDLDRRLSEGAVHQGMAIAVEPLQDVFLTDIMAAANAPNAERHVIVILDEVTDPHNVGAVLRSMSAFGAKAMIVHKRNAPGITGVMAKIATGAVEHVPMVAVTNIAQAMEELKNAGFFILGLDENADYLIQKAPTDGPVALVLGAEGEGLRAKTRTTCDAIASIETFGDIKSLNVSNAAAIALFALTKK